MEKILILHPEGNLNNNPNLTGIVEILCEKGFKVDIFSSKRENIYQEAPCENAYFYLEDYNNFKQLIKNFFIKYFSNYDLIIGVDRGIIEAAEIANINNLPYGFISYEIFFSEECGSKYKLDEIKSCKNISFAICQDKIRAKYLSIENHISEEKFIYIPVAGRGVKKNKKSFFLYEKLGISKEKHIALFIGSIERWTMADEIINSTKKWDDNWVLVLHGRYGKEGYFSECYKKYSNYKKVFFSFEPIASFYELHQIILSADVGIAFYKPTYENIYTGNNLKYIGMASGKIATYLQHGLPLIINDFKPMNSYVSRYKLGEVVTKIEEISNIFSNNFYFLQNRKNCYKFFEDYLDLNKTVEPFLKKIEYVKNYKRINQRKEKNVKLLYKFCVFIIKFIKYRIGNIVRKLLKNKKRVYLLNIICSLIYK